MQSSNWLKDKLKTEVKIGKVDADLFSKLILEDVLIRDKKNDTLLFAHQIKLNLTDVLLLQKNFTFNSIALNGVKIKVNKTQADSVFNYQFLLAAFTSKSSNNDSVKWKIQLRKIDLTDISFYLNDADNEIINASFAALNTNINQLDLNKKKLDVQYLKIQNPAFSYSLSEAAVKKDKIIDTSRSAIKLSWQASVEEFKIQNGAFSYCIHTADTTHFSPERINPNDISISKIDVQINRMEWKENDVVAQLKEISCKEKSGFEMRASSDFKFKNRKLTLKNFDVKTPFSQINENVEFDFGNEKIIQPEKIYFSAKIKNSSFHPNDIKHFVTIPNWIQPISLQGNVSGYIGKLRSKNIELEMGKSFFAGNFSVTGLPDLKNTFIDFNAKQFSTSGDELIKYLPLTQHPELLQRFGNIFFSGNFNGFINDFVAQGNLKTSLGNVNADLNMKINETGKLSYTGSIAAIQFDLGKLTNQDSLIGKISISADVDGKNWLNQNPEVNIRGELQQFEYNQYNYHDIELNGLLKQNQFNGAITSADPNIDFDFNGAVNVNDSLPVYNFSAIVHSIDFNQLHFSKKPFCISHAKMDINANGNTIDDFAGHFTVKDLLFDVNHHSYRIASIEAASNNVESGKKLSLKSDVINILVNGKLNYADLPAAFQNYLHQYFPAYVKQSERKILTQQQFSFECKINDKENLLPLIIPNLTLKGENNFAGNFDNDNSKASLKARFEDINWDGKKMKPLIALLQSDKEKIFGDVTSNNFSFTDSFIIHDSKLHFVAKHDSLDFNYSMVGDENKFAFNINGESVMFPEYANLHFFNSNIFIKGERWLLSAANQLKFEAGHFDITDLTFVNGNQSLSVNSFEENDKHDNLKIKCENFDLKKLSKMLGTESTDFTGTLNTISEIKNYTTNPFFDNKVEITDCKINKNLLGNVVGDISFQSNEKKVFADLGITQLANSLHLKGDYKIGDTISPLEFDISLKNFDIKTIQPLINDILSDKKGNLSGNASLAGTLSHPKITADVYLKNGGATVNYLNTHYNFEDVHAICKKNIIEFEQFNIVDSFKNKAAFTGTIDLNNLHHVVLDLHLQTKKLLVMNNTIQQNNIFFGTAYADGVIDVTGVTYNLTIAAKAKTMKGTSVNIPISDDRDISRHDFIKFVSNKKDSAKNKNNYVVDLDGLDLKLDIETTPDAEVNILMDLVSGDYIKGKGSGEIKVEFSNNKAFGMYGNYTMERGEYYFTLFNFPKTFVINNGSTINWDGDAYNGSLDVIGTYVTRASFADLIKDIPEEAAKSKTKTPVQVKMMLKGSLKHPDVGFDIVPLESSSTAVNFTALQRLQAIKADPNEMNNQVFALLAMNSFIQPQNIGGFDNALTYSSTYKQSATDLASTQVSRLLNNAFYTLTKNDKTQFNINYRLYDQSTDVRNVSQFQANITQKFLNDRLTIDVGGIYDYGSVNTANNSNGLAGDFTIEYNIIPDGRLKLKGFRKTEYDILSERNRNRTGLGIAYRKQFDSFKELFESKKKKKK